MTAAFPGTSPWARASDRVMSGRGVAWRVGDEQAGGLGRGDPGIQDPDDRDGQGAAEDLGGDEGGTEAGAIPA